LRGETERRREKKKKKREEGKMRTVMGILQHKEGETKETRTDRRKKVRTRSTSQKPDELTHKGRSEREVQPLPTV
jgi:hypothetical protein